jgi:3-hydroxyisobutyrate dehydrogenase-like beta-hydroxyacid dehydrogenase
MAASETIGFIGLGKAGWPMAAQLASAGHRLVVYDGDPERSASFAAAHGASAARSGRDFAAVTVLFTMLPHGGIVREALLGPLAVAEQLSPGTVVVDTSSADPLGSRALAAELAERGLRFVDAGVSENEIGGGKTGAITFMVGSDEQDTLERVRPLLEVVGERVFHVGRAGTGHANKTLNNYVSAAGLHAALDALMIGYRLGLDPAAMVAVLNVSTGRNFSTQQTLPVKALPRSFEPRYSLGHLAKDLGIAGALAEATGFASELPALLTRAFEAARDDIGPEEDLTNSLRHWERRAGATLAATTPPAPFGDLPSTGFHRHRIGEAS